MPVQCQAQADADLLLSKPLGMNFIKIQLTVAK